MYYFIQRDSRALGYMEFDGFFISFHGVIPVIVEDQDYIHNILMNEVESGKKKEVDFIHFFGDRKILITKLSDTSTEIVFDEENNINIDVYNTLLQLFRAMR